MSEQPRWRRPAVEGFVIVASILLAFGIDAAWEERNERQELESLADLVIADVRDDLSEMRRVSARADSVAAKVRALLELGQPEAGLPATDSLAQLAIGAWQGANFRPTISALDVAQGNPVWNRVPEGIRVDLSEYQAGWSPANLEAFLSAQLSLFKRAGDFGGLPVLVPPEEMVRLGVRPESLSRQGLVAFARDPDVRTWLVLQLAMVTSEQLWRDEWVARLEDMTVKLAAVSQVRR